MSELQETNKKLAEILELIPASGSFESARLAKQASKLGDRVLELCSHPEGTMETEGDNNGSRSAEMD